MGIFFIILILIVFVALKAKTNGVQFFNFKHFHFIGSKQTLRPTGRSEIFLRDPQLHILPTRTPAIPAHIPVQGCSQWCDVPQQLPRLGVLQRELPSAWVPQWGGCHHSCRRGRIHHHDIL